MALVLGFDGKERAANAAKGATVAAITPLYLGLLETLVADADGLSLSNVVSGNEVDHAGFYVPSTGRTEITFGSVTGDATGAVFTNTNEITWTNNHASPMTVGGFFVTDASSGTSGSILWVGTSNVGDPSFANGDVLTVAIGNVNLTID